MALPVFYTKMYGVLTSDRPICPFVLGLVTKKQEKAVHVCMCGCMCVCLKILGCLVRERQADVILEAQIASLLCPEVRVGLCPKTTLVQYGC